MKPENIISFENPEIGKVRTLFLDGEPWFVGKDVAEALGYANSRDALSHHVDDDDKGAAELDTPGGMQAMSIVNEAGLYSLIFGSRLDSAKKFKRWVAKEVLPELRKNGQYSMKGGTSLSNETNGYLSIVSELSLQLKDLRERNLELEQRLYESEKEKELFKHDAALYQKYVSSDGLLCFRETAKQLGISGSDFIKWLRDKRYIQSVKSTNYKAMKISIENGWMKIIPFRTAAGFNGYKTMVTPKGAMYFAEELGLNL